MELPAENGVHVWRCAVALPFITFVFVAARFYSRLILMRKGLGKDDYIIATTFIFLLSYSILIANATSNGLGLHIRQYTDDSSWRYYNLVGIATEMWLLASIGFKISLLVLYLELAGSKRKLRWGIYAAMVYVIEWLLANMVAGFMQCTPRDKPWKNAEMGWCVQSNVVSVVFGAGNISSNILLAVMPVLLIWRKRFMKTQEKIEFGVVILSGVVAFSFAIANWAVAIHGLNTDDKTWWAGVRFVLSIFEVHTGTICACIAGGSRLVTTSRPTRTVRDPTLNHWPNPPNAPSLQQTLLSRNNSFQSWQQMVSPVSSYPPSVRGNHYPALVSPVSAYPPSRLGTPLSSIRGTPLPSVRGSPLSVQQEFGDVHSRDQKETRNYREMVKSIYELDASVCESPAPRTSKTSSGIYEAPASLTPEPLRLSGRHNKVLADQSFLFGRHEDYDDEPRMFHAADLDGYWGSQPPPYSAMPATRVGPVQRSTTPLGGAASGERRNLPHIAMEHPNTPSKEELAKALHMAAQLQHATQKQAQAGGAKQQQQRLSPMSIPQQSQGPQNNRSPIQASPTLGPWQPTGIMQASQSSPAPRR